MISLGAHVPGNLSPPGDKGQAATGKRLAVQHGSQAVTGQRGKVGNFLRREAQVLSPLYHGMGQGAGSPAAGRWGSRLKTARTLLRGTTMHISEIAWSVGYPDALYFSRVFAASEGCSPSVYRAGQEHT